MLSEARSIDNDGGKDSVMNRGARH